MKAILETKRLNLGFPTKGQVDQYYNDIVRTNMFDTIIWDGPKNEDELHDYWKNSKVNEVSDFSKDLNVALVEKISGFYIGGASLRPVNGNPAIINLGYALAPKFHGKGFATEGVGALVDLAFSERNAERIFATIFPENQASMNVCRKLGFLKEGTLRRQVFKRGEWKDEDLFSITRPDWESKK